MPSASWAAVGRVGRVGVPGGEAVQARHCHVFWIAVRAQRAVHGGGVFSAAHVAVFLWGGAVGFLSPLGKASGAVGVGHVQVQRCLAADATALGALIAGPFRRGD